MDKEVESCAPKRTHTVGQMLDKRIANLRQELENACIVKAKAEAAQILDFPSDFLHQEIGRAHV